MKQIIQSYKTGEMKLDEVPRPQVASGMLLLETKASVVSAGTEKMLVDLAKKSLLGKAKARPDLVKKVIATAKKEGITNTLQKVRGKLDSPIPLGYSCAGIVRAVGRGVDEFQVGDFIACGGAGYANHAEYNVVPKNLCVRIPKMTVNCHALLVNRVDNKTKTQRTDNQFANNFIPFEEAAFATVGAIALQGVRQAGLTLGENVCVIGLGLIGQITVQLCKANGCRVIGADIDDNKLKLVKQLGADRAVHSKNIEDEVANLTNGVGADAVIITAAAQGSQLVEAAGEISRMKGRVVVVGFVGLDLPREVFYKKELDLKMSMSYGPGRYDAGYEERGHDYPLPYVRWTEQRNMQAFLELMAEGKVDIRSLITHRFPFERALEAYNMILEGKEPYLGVVFEYSPKQEPPKYEIKTATATSAENKVNIGVIGAGNFAKGVLLPRLSKHANARLHSVTTARGVSAKSVAESFGFNYCVQDKDQIFFDPEVNTVLIATRHNLHGPLVVEALKSGKHVFVEKPLCLTIQELKEIILATDQSSHKASPGQALHGKVPTENKRIYSTDDSTASNFQPSASNPVLMVGFNRRFSPFIKKIKTIIEKRSTPIVASYHVNAGFIPKDSWVQDPVEGGGRIIGEVCHFVDTLRFLIGSPVLSVQAASVRSDNRTHTNRDSLTVTIAYKDGSVGVIMYHALGHSNYPKERLEIAADEMVIVNKDYRQLEIFGRKKEKLKSKQDKGFDAEIESFVHSITKGGEPPIPIPELIETTLATFAVHESLNKGIIVNLSDFARHCELPLLVN